MAESLLLDGPGSVAVSLCNIVINEGSNCSLTCTASGGNPQTYSYQWRFQHKFSNSYQAVSGETGNDLLLRSASHTDAGYYSCVAANGVGERESDTALLNVNCTVMSII